MLESIFSSFVVVALSEMGDKTQLLAFALAARFKKPWQIMAGILVATLFNHALASYFGVWISEVVRHDILSYILAASFFAFGIWTLFPDSFNPKHKESKFGAFLTTAVLFFFVEMGDKTQLATAALGAHFRSAVTVTIGTTLGMLASDGIAVFLGETAAEKIPMKWIRWVAAGLFFLFGAISLWQVIRTP